MADRGFPNWDELYKAGAVERMPWFYPELDPDVRAALTDAGVEKGRLLDIGTGPGTQAIALAKAGFEVTGTDVSPAAVEKAAARAEAEGVRATFVRDDILSPGIGQAFDVVLDRGCFHVLAPEERPRYVASVARLLRPGGLLLLKCFSVKQPGTSGPHRFAPEDIRPLFEPAFDVLSIRESVYQGTLDPLPLALFSVMRNRRP